MCKKTLLTAVAWMFGATLSLSFMAVAGRELSHELTTGQIVFFRNFVGLVVMTIAMSYFGWGASRTSYFRFHVLRNTTHFFGQYAWFYGIAFLPLAEVFALEFTAPIWTTILAAVFIGERLNRERVALIGLGFIGILVMVRPGLSIISPVSLIVLLGAFLYAGSYTTTKFLSSYDSPITVVFYMTLIQFPIAFVFAIPNFHWPSLSAYPWVIGVGVFALTAHYCMVRSFKLAKASIVVPVDFLRLPLIACVAFIFYQETADVWIILGGAIVFLSTWVNTLIRD